ncbi:MAG: hypothetical protein K8R21_14025, partial [Leptospira sp.]|nr:hypothetical protein [Leptospira sp.]
MAILFLLLAGIFLNCNTKHPGSKLGVTDVLFLQIAQNSVSLNGKVTNGNGYIIGGRVIVTALAVNGTCDKTATGSAIIAETTSDTSGNYSTTFNRTGQPV